MLHIICIIWGDLYSDEYVNKLYRSISRNTSYDFKFTCFTDRERQLEVAQEPIPFFTGDWYSKISLYNKDLYDFNSQVFYFDLDTVITNNLDTILAYDGNFAVLEDFTHRDRYGSGFMSWKPEAVHHMWENFTPEWKDRFGDQAWCELHYPKADFWQRLYPEKIVSYKIHVAKSMYTRVSHAGSLDTASIVCFHGRPNPHEVAKLEWMKQHWI